MDKHDSIINYDWACENFAIIMNKFFLSWYFVRGVFDVQLTIQNGSVLWEAPLETPRQRQTSNLPIGEYNFANWLGNYLSFGAMLHFILSKSTTVDCISHRIFFTVFGTDGWQGSVLLRPVKWILDRRQDFFLEWATTKKFELRLNKLLSGKARGERRLAQVFPIKKYLHTKNGMQGHVIF